MTKKDQLKQFMRNKGTFATHEILEYGTRHYFNRADRTKRDFMAEGLVRKLSKAEKALNNWNNKDAVYEWVGEKCLTA